MTEGAQEWRTEGWEGAQEWRKEADRRTVGRSRGFLPPQE